MSDYNSGQVSITGTATTTQTIRVATWAGGSTNAAGDTTIYTVPASKKARIVAGGVNGSSKAANSCTVKLILNGVVAVAAAGFGTATTNISFGDSFSLPYDVAPELATGQIVKANCTAADVMGYWIVYIEEAA